jgi:hypothetical protein
MRQGPGTEGTSDLAPHLSDLEGEGLVELLRPLASSRKVLNNLRLCILVAKKSPSL